MRMMTMMIITTIGIRIMLLNMLLIAMMRNEDYDDGHDNDNDNGVDDSAMMMMMAHSIAALRRLTEGVTAIQFGTI